MRPMKIIFTIDTEHGWGGVPYKITGDLTEFGIKENYGISAIMDSFEKYSMKAVFFTNVYEAGYCDPPYENCIENLST